MAVQQQRSPYGDDRPIVLDRDVRRALAALPIVNDAATWTANNPVLPVGRIGVESDTGKIKTGDGTTAWTALDYTRIAIGMRETGGPTTLTLGAIADGQFLKRSGSTVVGAAGGGGGAPTTSEYLVGAADAGLDAERVVTNTGTVTWDLATAGQAKANVPDATTTTKGAVELATDGESAANVVVQGNDARMSNARTPTGTAGGSNDLGGTYPDPTVTQARGLRETGGPTTLAMGAVADGALLTRSGATIVGTPPSDIVGLPITKQLGSQHDSASSTGTEVTGLSTTLVAGTYTFVYYLITQAANTTVGMSLGINYTGTITRLAAFMRWCDGGTTAINGVATGSSAASAETIHGSYAANTKSTTTPNMGALTNHAVANSDTLVIVEGIIVVSDGGDLELWHASDAANNTSIMVGSSLVLTKIAAAA